MASTTGPPNIVVIQNAIILKAAHPDPFSTGPLKAKIFIQQINNKIADIFLAMDARKIRYATSLFREAATKWALSKTNDEEIYICLTYREFRKEFLEQFTEPNPTGTAMEKLLNLRQGRMEIQEYCTKVLNLAYKVELENQAAKALAFRGTHLKDQDRIMMTNSIKTEEKLRNETLTNYLERITRLLQREEVRRQRDKAKAREESHKTAK